MKSNILDVTYFVTFVQRNFGNMQVFLPLEVFEPEMEFPLSIFTLKECESNSLTESS